MVKIELLSNTLENNPVPVLVPRSTATKEEATAMNITGIGAVLDHHPHNHKIRYFSSSSSSSHQKSLTQKPSIDYMLDKKFLPYTLVIERGQIFTKPKTINPPPTTTVTGPLVIDEKNETLPFKKRMYCQCNHSSTPKQQQQQQRQEEDTDENNKKKRKKIMKKSTGVTPVLVHNPLPSPPPPELPQEFKEKIARMRGSEPVFIIEKGLFKSDVNKHLNRLSFPVKQVKSEFLTPEEKTFLDSPNQEIGVRVIDPYLREWSSIDLNKWDMKKSSNYVLISKWSEFCSKNGLKQGTVVQLWAFRVDDKLCFALLKLKE